MFKKNSCTLKKTKKYNVQMFSLTSSALLIALRLKTASAGIVSLYTLCPLEGCMFPFWWYLFEVNMI